MISYDISGGEWFPNTASYGFGYYYYSQTSKRSCTKSQHLNVSHLVLQLSLPNPLKPGVKSRMKMELGQR